MTSRQKRPKDADAIEVALRVFNVLEALEGDQFQAVSLQTVQERTGYSYDFTRRALLTLQAAGYARKNGSNWQIAARLMLFSNRFSSFAEKALKNSEISEEQAEPVA